MQACKKQTGKTKTLMMKPNYVQSRDPGLSAILRDILRGDNP